MKEITKSDAIKLLSKIGKLVNVTIPVKDYMGDVKNSRVLNYGWVCNPFYGSRSSSDDLVTAESIIRFILMETGEFTVYSYYFSYTNGEYKIMD